MLPAVLHTYFPDLELKESPSNFVGGTYLAIEKTDPRIQFFSQFLQSVAPYMPTTISSST